MDPKRRRGSVSCKEARTLSERWSASHKLQTLRSKAGLHPCRRCGLSEVVEATTFVSLGRAIAGFRCYVRPRTPVHRRSGRPGLGSDERHAERALWRELPDSSGSLWRPPMALVLTSHLRFATHIGVWLKSANRSTAISPSPQRWSGIGLRVSPW